MSSDFPSFEADVAKARDAAQSPSAETSGGGMMDKAKAAVGAVQEKAGALADQAGLTSGDGSTGGAMDKAKDALGGVQQKAGDLGGQATDKADAGMEKAVGGLDSLASTLRDKSESMGQGQVQSVAAAAAVRLQSGADVLRGKDTDQLVAELESLVRRKPAESLAVALGLGFLLSKAFR